jgi:hypothetical protein
MPITLNGTTGVTTPGATVGSITGILKATSGVVSQAVAGSDYFAAGSGSCITLATAQTVPIGGTTVDFTGIPSWAKRITVMMRGISINANGNISLRLGTSSGLVTTGYTGMSTRLAEAGTSLDQSTTGLKIYTSDASIYNICMNIQTMGNNIWISDYLGSGQTQPFVLTGSGSVSLSGTLDRLQIFVTDNALATFDAGTINISYE